MTPRVECTRCGCVYNAEMRGPCVMTVGRVPCDGTVINVVAEIGRLVPAYDPAWWIVTTGENVIRPRWEMPIS